MRLFSNGSGSIPQLLPLLLLWLCACDEAPPRSGTGDRALRTTAPSRLYFKNVRASDYASTEEDASRADIYRFRDFPDTAAAPMLLPVIVDNWLEDEAYVRFATIPYPQGYARPLQLIGQTAGQPDTLTLNATDPAAQLAFAERLYRMLKRNGRISIVTTDPNSRSLGLDESGQQWTLTVLEDYLRLVERL